MSEDFNGEFPRTGNLLRDLIIRLDQYGLEYVRSPSSLILLRLRLLKVGITDPKLTRILDEFYNGIIYVENIREGRTRYDVISLVTGKPEIKLPSKLKSLLKRSEE